MSEDSWQPLRDESSSVVRHAPRISPSRARPDVGSPSEPPSVCLKLNIGPGCDIELSAPERCRAARVRFAAVATLLSVVLVGGLCQSELIIGAEGSASGDRRFDVE